MKNQIFIKRPKNANYPKGMILMERNILASILSHESGQKFIRPIFKSFFPQIKNNDQLFIDSTIEKRLNDRGCFDFDGIVAYTKERDYYILNVHSPKHSKSSVKAVLDLLAHLKVALYPAEESVNKTEPTFYYLGLLPNIEFKDLPSGETGHYMIKEMNFKGDSNQNTLRFHLEAMKNRDVPSFGHSSWGTRWAFLLQAFGDPTFYIPEEKGNKYFKEFYETVCIMFGSVKNNETEGSAGEISAEADYIKLANELLNESGLRELLEDLETYVQVGENPTYNSNRQDDLGNNVEDDTDNGAVRVILGVLDARDELSNLFDNRTIVKKKYAASKTNNLN